MACSAATLKAGKEGAFSQTGYGGRPFDNWRFERLRLIWITYPPLICFITHGLEFSDTKVHEP